MTTATMTPVTVDPALAAALKAFPRQIQKLALATVNRFIYAINAGDEAAADAVDNEIFQARGAYGQALDVILRVANGACTITTPQIDGLIDSAAISKAGQFILVSTAFGYAIYATSTDGDITDTLEGATRFAVPTNDPAKLAAAMTAACGYEFKAVAA